MTPFFSIITATLQRESLIQTCENIDNQTYQNFEHLIQIDSNVMNVEVLSRLPPSSNRFVDLCLKHHSDGGNSCRRLALERATGIYCYFNDDDNVLADNDVLKDIAAALESADRPPWAIFPITRLGGRFYSDPPRSCHVDTMNFILRRDIAYWPNTDAYGTDGIVVDDLMARGIPYAAFPDFRPIGIIPKISFCK